MNLKLIRLIDKYIGIPLIWILQLLALNRKTEHSDLLHSDVSNILLIKFWGIGNLFMLLPTLQALQATWPKTSIDFLTLESSREAMEITGSVNEIITIDTATPMHFMRTWREAVCSLRRKKYDLIIDFEQFARFSALTVHQIGAVRTIGFSTEGQHRHLLFSDSVPYDNEIHITRSFYSLAQEAGVALPFSSEVAFAHIGEIRRNGILLLHSFGILPETPVILLHIGTSDNFSERRWSPHSYAALADFLIDQHRVHILLTGLPEEAHLIQLVLLQMKNSAHAHDLGGKLPFKDYFSLISAVTLVISADTSAVHLASAVHTPVVGLYGPNTPNLYGPWGENGRAMYADFDCSPCISNFNSKINTCRHPKGAGACMAAITVEDVGRAAEMLLNGNVHCCRLETAEMHSS